MKLFYFWFLAVIPACRPMSSQDCDKAQDCGDLMAECIDNVCECIDNALMDPDISDKCVCDEGYSNKGDRCIKDFEGPPIALPCQLTRHCVTYLGVHSECIKRNCYCVEGARYLADGGPQTCFKVQHEIGGPCESDAECGATSTKCTKNACQCGEGFVASPDNSVCIEDVKLLDGPCHLDAQCNQLFLGEGVTCLNGKCDCSAAHKRAENRCVNKRNIGEDCDDDNNCDHILHTTCVDATCACADDYVTDVNATMCLEVAGELKAPCQQDNQCSEAFGDGATCTGNGCQCKHKYVFSGSLKTCVEEEEEVSLRHMDTPRLAETTDHTPLRASTSGAGFSSLMRGRLCNQHHNAVTMAIVFISWAL